MNELAKRISVAIVGIPLALFVMMYGQLIFTIVVIVLYLLAVSEFYNFTEKKGNPAIKWLSMISGSIALFSYYWNLSNQQSIRAIFSVIITLVLFVFATMLINLWRDEKISSVNTLGTTLATMFYPFFGFFALLAIRNFDLLVYSKVNNIKLFASDSHLINGLNGINTSGIVEKFNIGNPWADLLILIFASVWICDSAAYFAGRAFGKHKLFPRHSPKKSWEGAIAGFVGAILFFYYTSQILFPEMSTITSILIGAIVGFFGQLGDLVESHLKRDAQVKDSSNLIPGHGGILDRFDSIIFVAPLILVYLLILAIF